jgi:hypothetical protein
MPTMWQMLCWAPYDGINQKSYAQSATCILKVKRKRSAYYSINISPGAIVWMCPPKSHVYWSLDPKWGAAERGSA